MRLRWSLALAAAVVAGAGCGGGDEGEETAAPAAGDATSISLIEFALDPAAVTLDAPGTYTFRAVNDGNADHALEIEGNGIEEETETIGPGESAEVTVEITEPGEYELYCPVGDHKDLGMDGTLTVNG